MHGSLDIGVFFQSIYPTSQKKSPTKFSPACTTKVRLGLRQDSHSNSTLFSDWCFRFCNLADCKLLFHAGRSYGQLTS